MVGNLLGKTSLQILTAAVNCHLQLSADTGAAAVCAQLSLSAAGGLSFAARMEMRRAGQVEGK